MGYFKKYTKRKEKNLFISGYNYAAGALLRKEETPMSIDSNCWGFESSSSHYFDLGCDMAIEELIRLKVIEDDRL